MLDISKFCTTEQPDAPPALPGQHIFDTLRACGLALVEFSEMENTKGDCSKRYSLSPAGELQKEVAAAVYAGKVRRRFAIWPAGFADELADVATNKALIWGTLARDGDEFVLTTKEHASADKIARTKGEFAFREDAPGIMLGDIDIPKGSNATPEEIIAKVFVCVPELREYACVLWYSASAYLYEGDRQVQGGTGARMYFAVEPASHIPAVGKLIADRMKACGEVWFKVSSAGTAIEQTLFDTVVWTQERADFAAGAICSGGLRQDRGRPVVVEYDADGKRLQPVLHLSDIRQLTAEEMQKKDACTAAARAAVETERAAQRAIWKAKQAARGVAKGLSPAKVDAQLDRIFTEGVIPEWIVVELEDGRRVTVSQIIESPADFNRLRCKDPVEPDHRGGEFCAVIYSQYKPCIKTLARGGETLRLEGKRPVVTKKAGALNATLRACVPVLKAAGVMLNSMGQPCEVQGRRLKVVDKEGRRLRQILAGGIDYQEWRESGGGRYVEADPPMELAKDLMACEYLQELPRVVSVIDHPTIAPGGRLIAAPGFDEETGILLVEPEGGWRMPVPKAGTAAVIAATNRLLALSAELPTSGPVGLGVVLSTYMTVVVRPCIATAPIYMFSANLPGTGKSYAAECPAALALGERAPLTPPDGFKGDEAGKTLAALVQKASPVIIIDNWDPKVDFGSSGLDMMLTAGKVEVRILGTPVMFEGALRATAFVTGNQLKTNADVVRRSMRDDFDAQMETPERRTFKSDPLAEILRNRQSLIADVLTIILGWFEAGRPGAGDGGKVTSFEEWDELVRRPIMWLKTLGLPVDDPAKSQTSAKDNDSGLLARASLSDALWRWQADADVCDWLTGDVMNVMRDAREREAYLQRTGDAKALADFRQGAGVPGLGLYAVLSDALGQGVASTKSVGRCISSLVDVRAQGRVLRRRKLNGTWRYTLLPV